MTFIGAILNRFVLAWLVNVSDLLVSQQIKNLLRHLPMKSY